MSWQYPSLEIQSRRKPLTYLDFQNAFRVTSSSIMSEAGKWGAKKHGKKGVLFSLEKANIASVAKRRPRNSRKQKKAMYWKLRVFPAVFCQTIVRFFTTLFFALICT